MSVKALPDARFGINTSGVTRIVLLAGKYAIKVPYPRKPLRGWLANRSEWIQRDRPDVNRPILTIGHLAAVYPRVLFQGTWDPENCPFQAVVPSGLEPDEDWDPHTPSGYSREEAKGQSWGHGGQAWGHGTRIRWCLIDWDRAWQHPRGWIGGLYYWKQERLSRKWAALPHDSSPALTTEQGWRARAWDEWAGQALADLQKPLGEEPIAPHIHLGEGHCYMCGISLHREQSPSNPQGNNPTPVLNPQESNPHPNNPTPAMHPTLVHPPSALTCWSAGCTEGGPVIPIHLHLRSDHGGIELRQYLTVYLCGVHYPQVMALARDGLWSVGMGPVPAIPAPTPPT